MNEQVTRKPAPRISPRPSEAKPSLLVHAGALTALLLIAFHAIGYLYERMYLEHYGVVYTVVAQGPYELTMSGIRAVFASMSDFPRFGTVCYFILALGAADSMAADIASFKVRKKPTFKASPSPALGIMDAEPPLCRYLLVSFYLGLPFRFIGWLWSYTPDWAKARSQKVLSHTAGGVRATARFLWRYTPLLRFAAPHIGHWAGAQSVKVLRAFPWILRIFLGLSFVFFAARFGMKDEIELYDEAHLQPANYSTLWRKGEDRPYVGLILRCNDKSCALYQPNLGQAETIPLDSVAQFCAPSLPEGVIKRKHLQDVFKEGMCRRPRSSAVSTVAPK